jgi:hypothetical protein
MDRDQGNARSCKAMHKGRKKMGQLCFGSIWRYKMAIEKCRNTFPADPKRR